MIIKFKNDVTEKQVSKLKSVLLKQGFELHESIGESTHLLGVIGDTISKDINSLYS